MIELKFIEGYDLTKTKIIELASFEAFFNFYLENHDKGCIYDVKLIENSPWIELQKQLSDFAEKNNLTYDDVLKVVEKVRNEEK